MGTRQHSMVKMMNGRRVAVATVTLLIAPLTAAPARAADAPAPAQPPKAEQPSPQQPAEGQPARRPSRKLIKFVPNVDSAPANLGTATARASELEPGLAVSVLAPQDREGLTAEESPSLFWFTTKPTN